MRFAILPLLIHRESQFVPAGNDVLIQVPPRVCAFSGQMTLSKPSYQHMMLRVEAWPLLFGRIGHPGSFDEQASHGSRLIVLLLSFFAWRGLGIRPLPQQLANQPFLM
jgi:hypothetical protein